MEEGGKGMEGEEEENAEDKDDDENEDEEKKERDASTEKVTSVRYNDSGRRRFEMKEGRRVSERGDA